MVNFKQPLVGFLVYIDEERERNASIPRPKRGVKGKALLQGQVRAAFQIDRDEHLAMMVCIKQLRAS